MTLALHQYLQDLASHADLHGVLGVYADGAAVAEQACGHADLANGRKNAPDTRFRIGSLSKSHTAAAILLLAQHGKLDLHDSAARHLPDCGLDPRITPMHLLRHRSGLGNHTALPAYWPELMGRHIAPEDLIRLITASPLMDTPGQACRYSNTGYAVLARIAERVGGDALHDQLRTMFWQALELRETGSIDTAHSIGCMLGPDRPPAPPLHPSVAFGAYDLAASARDLARWWLSLIDGKVLDAAHTDLMLGGPPGDFGCGWWLDEIEIDGRRWRSVAHKGDVNGHTSMLLGLPERRLCAVVLFNTASTPASATARRLLGLAMGEAWPAYPAALTEHVDDWAQGAYRDEQGATYVVDTARRLIAATRDYGVPCRYAIRPSQAGPDAQAWRADAFDERHEFHRAAATLTITSADGSKQHCRKVQTA